MAAVCRNRTPSILHPGYPRADVFLTVIERITPYLCVGGLGLIWLWSRRLRTIHLSPCLDPCIASAIKSSSCSVSETLEPAVSQHHHRKSASISRYERSTSSIQHISKFWSRNPKPTSFFKTNLKLLSDHWGRSMAPVATDYIPISPLECPIPAPRY
jgi:hypothetical protein